MYYASGSLTASVSDGAFDVWNSPCLVGHAGVVGALPCASSVRGRVCGRVGLEVGKSLEVDAPGCRRTRRYVDQEEDASVREREGERAGPR